MRPDESIAEVMGVYGRSAPNRIAHCDHRWLYPCNLLSAPTEPLRPFTSSSYNTLQSFTAPRCARTSCRLCS